MHIRRTLTAIAVGGGLLLGGLAAPAGAAPIVVVVTTLGRNVPTYTSYPTDPTPVSKWIASSQGEYVDDNYVTKPDPNALRGRAAVQETFGVKRVRIYDVKLQQLQANGTWLTLKQNPTDVINEGSRAYAVSYTPTIRTCWEDDLTKKTYRVVNSHGIRRNDGIVANRTTYSKSFKGPRLASDPTCSIGMLSANGNWEGVGDDGLWELNHHVKLTTFHGYATAEGVGSAQGIVAHMIFSEGITVDGPNEWVLDTATPAPNDWKYTGPSTWQSHEYVEAEWDLVRTDPGPQQVNASLTTTTPRVLPMTSLDFPWEIDKLDTADLALDVELPTHDGYNEDRDAEREGLQLQYLDTVTYTFQVTNAGPDNASRVVIEGDWPKEAGDIFDIWGKDGTSCWVDDGPHRFTCELGEVASDDAPKVYVQAQVRSYPEAITEAGLTAEVRSNAMDPNHGNNSDSVSFEVIPGGLTG